VPAKYSLKFKTQCQLNLVYNLKQYSLPAKSSLQFNTLFNPVANLTHNTMPYKSNLQFKTL